MDCQWVKERIFAFIDGELPLVERREIEEHLASCKSCAEELAIFTRIQEVSQTLTKYQPSGFFEARLKSRLQEKPVHSWVTLFLNRKIRWAVVIPILLIIGIVIFRQRTTRHVQPVHVKADYYYMETEAAEPHAQFVVEQAANGESDKFYIIPAVYYDEGSF